MQYREKILELIFSEDESAFENWWTAQPDLEQVDILREYKELTEELMNEAGTPPTEEYIELMQQLETGTEKYEEACLDVQVASLKYEMAEADLEKVEAEMEKAVEGMKAYAKECIETNAENAPDMRRLALQIMTIEKENGIYDPEDWRWLEETGE